MSCGVQLDSSMDIMEETRFKKKHSVMIQRLARELHFSLSEVESIMLIYYKLQKDAPDKQGGVSRTQVGELLHCALDMTDEELTSDIVMSMVRGPNPIVPMEKWASIFSLFLRGTADEKTLHCFGVYDRMMQGKIARDMVLRFLTGSIICLTDDESEEAVKDMIEILTKKVDWDRDGKISFEDFKKTCTLQPLLMECMGQCLPSRVAIHSFLTSFSPNIGKL